MIFYLNGRIIRKKSGFGDNMFVMYTEAKCTSYTGLFMPRIPAILCQEILL